MARWLKLWTLMAALVAVLGLSACGEDEGKTGGTVKVLGSAYPDFLDPALSFTVDGWQALAQVYPGLLTFRHESGQEGAEPVPALAENLPDVSNDRKTYKFKLREGLQFSDGTPIKASDVKASIERILALDSQGSSFYTSIVGAEQFLETKKGGLKGIKADDENGEVTIDLVSPRGTFLYELAIPFGGVVPKSTPAENRTKNPPPGAGRYKFADVKVNRGYSLVRNENFSDALEGTAVDAGKVDRIDVEIDRSVANQVTKVSRNKADFMIDNPPADRIAEIKKKFEDRYREFPTNSTFYFFMNTEAAPFDKLEVRQAVNYAIDPEAINRIQGGVLEPSHGVLPKGVPGYKKTDDLYPGPDLDRARKLIKDAGAAGAKVTVWGNPEDPTKQTVEYYADVLNDIGLKAKTKLVSPETYFTTVGDRSVKAQTGYTNWFQDYPHPADFIDVLLNPDNVTPTGNTNFTYNTKDKELAEKINALRGETELTSDVKDRWAEIDREIQEKAYWAIFGSRKQSTFFSERMDFENCKGDEHPVWQHDWAQFCLKE